MLGICLSSNVGSLGYAVPIDVARKVADAIRESGTVHWARLGVHGVDLDRGRARDLGVPGGALLEEVDANSPAANAGLSKGDIVVGLGVDRIDSVGSLIRALRGPRTGRSGGGDLPRGTRSHQVDATLNGA